MEHNNSTGMAVQESTTFPYSLHNNTICFEGYCFEADGNYTYYECLLLPMGHPACNLTEGDYPISLMNTVNKFTVPIYGYITPILVLITLLTNILVCLVLFKKNMRSPTNTLLGAMAISDMLTGVWPVPCFIFFYTFGNFQDWVPFNWCYAYDCLTEYMPTIFHTASIWLTVALAVQRYIFVCHSINAKQWCTMQNAIKVIVVCYILAFVSQMCRFVENEHYPRTVRSRIDSSIEVNACVTQFNWFVRRYLDIYFNVYFWFRVVFIHLIPCVTLMVLNALLIHAMRAAQRRRELLLMQNRKTECRRLKESTYTTLMLVAVVGLFLLVEFPQAIFLTIVIVENNFEIQILETETRDVASLFINLFILFSYPVNFFIYCTMSRQFRNTFKRLFISNAAALENEQSQYVSLPVQNGNTCKTAETAI